MLFGLGWPEWMVIVGLVGGLLLTFWLMAKGQVAYERRRQARDAMVDGTPKEAGKEEA